MENLNVEKVISELRKNDSCYVEDIKAIRNAIALINSQEQEKEKLGFLISELEKEKRELWEERNRIYNDLQDWKAIAEGYQKQFEDCAEDRARLTEENERLRAEVSVKKKLLDEAERRYDETAKRFYKEGVKDIQSEIKKSLSALCKGDVSEIHRMIDQTAKELLESE